LGTVWLSHGPKRPEVSSGDVSGPLPGPNRAFSMRAFLRSKRREAGQGSAASTCTHRRTPGVDLRAPTCAPPDRYKPLCGAAVGPPLEPGTRPILRRRVTKEDLFEYYRAIAPALVPSSQLPPSAGRVRARRPALGRHKRWVTCSAKGRLRTAFGIAPCLRPACSGLARRKGELGRVVDRQ
jgi:hypothetical protein